MVFLAIRKWVEEETTHQGGGRMIGIVIGIQIE
jgi:hypothetical protein